MKYVSTVSLRVPTLLAMTHTGFVDKGGKMALLRVLSKIDADGKVVIPGNVLRATGMKKGEPIELKVTGVGAKHILISSGHFQGLKRRPRPKSGIPIPAR